MKRINAWQKDIEIEGQSVSIVIIEQETEYDIYYQKPNEILRFMFGLFKDRETLDSALDIAIANIPDYINDYE